LCGEILYYFFPTLFPFPSLYGAAGAAAGLSSASHTISPILMVLELTMLPNIHIPVVLSGLSGYYVSSYLGESMFTMIMRMKKIPFVSPVLPDAVNAENLTVGDLIKTKRLCLRPRCTISEVKEMMDLAQKMNCIYIPLVKSVDDLTLVGAVTLDSLNHLLSNRPLLEKAIIKVLFFFYLFFFGLAYFICFFGLVYFICFLVWFILVWFILFVYICCICILVEIFQFLPHTYIHIYIFHCHDYEGNRDASSYFSICGNAHQE
jgi:hypothetical protein